MKQTSQDAQVPGFVKLCDKFRKERKQIPKCVTDGVRTCRKRWAASWDTCQRRAARWPGLCALAPGHRRWTSGSWWRQERTAADCCWWACAARRCSGPRWGPTGPLQREERKRRGKSNGSVGGMRGVRWERKSRTEQERNNEETESRRIGRKKWKWRKAGERRKVNKNRE